MNQVIIPENYHSVLSMYETQDAIGIIKEMMQKKLCMALRLKRGLSWKSIGPAWKRQKSGITISLGASWNILRRWM